MPRDALAYLSDAIESCDAITAALLDLDLEKSGGSVIGFDFACASW
jgi:hypothetical protein